MELNVDCLKYRKSTHLAGVDVETITHEKGVCDLTIDIAYYEKNVNVAGKKVDGYFLRFKENGIKEMMVNTGNRKKIAYLVMRNKNLKPVEARNLSNWGNMVIRLKFDPNIKMAGQTVGGIVVDESFEGERIDIEKYKKMITECQNSEDLVKVWTSQGFPQKDLFNLKEKKKNELLGNTTK